MYNLINNRFTSKYDGFKETSLFKVLKWRISNIKTTKRIVDYKLKVARDLELINSKKDFISWLGHSTFLIQIDGFRIITDPVMFNVPMFKRKVEFPYSVDELGQIDYILISHSHYDHLDIKSIKLLSKFSPTLITPLKMGRYLKSISNIKIIELDWFSKIKVSNDLTINFLPAKHWGRRGVFDTNKTLWGSFLINDIYFAGDTSYFSHFKEIGEKFKISKALMPIGAYKPEEIMKSNHMNPKEAIQGSLDLKADEVIPMHFGTFKLSDEDFDEPIKLAYQESKAHNIKLKELNIGSGIYL